MTGKIQNMVGVPAVLWRERGRATQERQRAETELGSGQSLRSKRGAYGRWGQGYVGVLQPARGRKHGPPAVLSRLDLFAPAVLIKSILRGPNGTSQ